MTPNKTAAGPARGTTARNHQRAAIIAAACFVGNLNQCVVPSLLLLVVRQVVEVVR